MCLKLRMYNITTGENIQQSHPFIHDYDSLPLQTLEINIHYKFN